jgi:hypothetical protein
MTCPIGDRQMLPLHTKVTWRGRGDDMALFNTVVTWP